jgi:hypothetical protein
MLKQLLIEVIGHVFGLSDEQLEQIEQSLPATKVLIVLLNKAHPIIEQAQTLDEETQPLANNVIFEEGAGWRCWATQAGVGVSRSSC